MRLKIESHLNKREIWSKAFTVNRFWKKNSFERLKFELVSQFRKMSVHLARLFSILLPCMIIQNGKKVQHMRLFRPVRLLRISEYIYYTTCSIEIHQTIFLPCGHKEPKIAYRIQQSKFRRWEKLFNERLNSIIEKQEIVFLIQTC